MAIKVQYPGVAEALHDDLKARNVLRDLVGADLGDALRDDAIAALRERLDAELDYQAEAEALRRFKFAFASDPSIVIPAVVPKHSTKRVLTMERLFGRSLPALSHSGTADERNGAATTILRFAMLSPWRHRLINLDPNPGNYLILDAATEIGVPPRVGFVDFGCTASISDELAAADKKLFLAMIHRDGEELRYAAHLCGLIESATSFHSTVYRRWEQTLSAPFMSRELTQLEHLAHRGDGDAVDKAAPMLRMALTAAMSTMVLAPLVNAAQEMNRAQQRVSRYSTLRVCQDIGAFALGTFLAWRTGLGAAAPFVGLAGVLALLAAEIGRASCRERVSSPV